MTRPGALSQAQQPQAPQQPPPPTWDEHARQAHSFNVDAARAAVQVHGRGPLDLHDTVMQIPLSAVLSIAAAWLHNAAAIDLPTQLAPSIAAAAAAKAFDGNGVRRA